MATSRFRSPSTGLSLSKLHHHGRRALFAGLASAVVAHLCLTQITGLRQEEKAAKPLTTRFVKRQPRLTKPLEMRKRPQPRRRQVQRKMVAVKARQSRKQVSGGIQPVHAVRSLARPRVQVGRVVGMGAMDLEPDAVAQRIVGAREDKHVVNMALEMVDTEALDTGRYQAMVVDDPGDKRNIKGFLRLRYAYSESMQKRHYFNFEDRMIRGLLTLIEGMNQYTQIKARLEGRVPFTSSEMAKTPWVYCSHGSHAKAFRIPRE